MIKIQNTFKKLENVDFQIVSDFQFRASNFTWSFLNLWRKPLSLSVNCWRGGVPIEGEQEGESQPFRGWKG
jgi:hypothetical protein